MNKANRKPRTRTKPATSVAPFLHKIYEILENPVHNDLISWNEEGTAFLIRNVTEFTEKVLPKYFKHNNFASFVRQLNLYDFHKSRYENNGSEFFHKLFRRHEKHLLSEIKRKMPNDGGSDSPPQYTGIQEEMGMENIVPRNCQGDASLQNLISRQDQLENAMKMVFTENKRLSKENKMLWTEVTSLKNKQVNTEKATKTINTQNTQLLKENRCLWSELIMNKEKFERQIEKLLVLLFSIAQHSGKTPSNLFKKKNLSNTRNTATNNEEEDTTWTTQPENNNTYSVMPAKNYNNKKGKSHFDKILEHFEEEGLGSLFGNKPFVMEEKDWIKFSSFLDVETGGNNNLQSLEFFNDKRPSQIDTSFDKEDPRDTFSKMCKIEYDTAVPTIVEEKNTMEVPSSPNFERLLKPERLFDITNSPVPLEKAMNELELSPVAAKGRPGLFEYDVVHGSDTCFLQLQKNPSFFQNNFLEEEFENENENQQDEKRDISYFMNRSFNKSRGSSQVDINISAKGEPKFDEVMHFFNNHQLSNSNNHGDNHDSFHNSFFNLSGMNAMHNDPHS